MFVFLPWPATATLPLGRLQAQAAWEAWRRPVFTALILTAAAAMTVSVLTEAMASGLAVAGFDYAAAQQFVRHGENGLRRVAGGGGGAKIPKHSHGRRGTRN